MLIRRLIACCTLACCVSFPLAALVSADPDVPAAKAPIVLMM